MWIEWRKDKVETTGELFVQEIEMKSTKAVLRSIADIPPLSMKMVTPSPVLMSIN